MSEESIHVGERAADLNEPPSYVHNCLRASLGELNRLHKKLDNSDNLHIKSYTATPAISLFQYDEVLWVGFFWHAKSSLAGIQLKIQGSESVCGKKITTHFDALWEKAENYDTLLKNG